jgi:hypothetical protein
MTCAPCPCRCAGRTSLNCCIGRPGGIFLSSFEQGEIDSDLFRPACLMGLEELVSKRHDRPYRSDRSKDRSAIRRHAVTDTRYRYALAAEGVVSPDRD